MPIFVRGNSHSFLSFSLFKNVVDICEKGVIERFYVRLSLSCEKGIVFNQRCAIPSISISSSGRQMSLTR